ncbi:DUF1697 domain-containing protein [Salinibacterium sp. TMP30]|uniref:DUF1697 domain-containing protein n=1 Tax=Salinibacterium sp. TMP30 TaxID=3138237 RepID=UPI003139DEFB
MAKYVALLRGINVGGKNLISVTSLVECFSAAGYGDVRTTNRLLERLDTVS